MYRYDAFISYRHHGLDGEVAEKLQKKLERYRPPKALRGKDFSAWHVFRDETELSAGSDLDANIKAALDTSRFLIVVCSERTRESRWCMEEIEYFKTIHSGKTDNIITLVVDGEPENVFPAPLCTETVMSEDADGNPIFENRRVEPLAASIAAGSRGATMKNFRREFLRIAAPMLGCGYDDLYQRAQRGKIRRGIIAAAAVAVLILLFALYSSAMLFKISTQAADLARTNEDLTRKTEEAEANLAEAERQRAVAEENLAEAERQRALAEENLLEAKRQQEIAAKNAREAEFQRNIAVKNEAAATRANRDLKEKNAQILTDQAQLYLEDGRLFDAARAALSALTENGPNADAEFILAQATGAYALEEQTVSSKLELSGSPEYLRMSGDGSRVFCYDSENTVYIIDQKQAKILHAYAGRDVFGSDYAIDCAEVDGDAAYVLCDRTVAAFDLSDGSILWTYERDGYGGFDTLALHAGGDTLAVVGYNTPVFLDRKSGTEVAAAAEDGPKAGYTNRAVMAPDGTLYVVNESDHALVTFRAGEPGCAYDLPVFSEKTKLMTAALGEEALYLALIDASDNTKGTLVSIDPAAMKENWRAEFHGEYLSAYDEHALFEQPQFLSGAMTMSVVLLADDGLYVFDRKSGKTLVNAEADGTVYNAAPNGNLMILHTDEGYCDSLLLMEWESDGVVSTQFVGGGDRIEGDYDRVASANGAWVYGDTGGKELTLARSLPGMKRKTLERFPSDGYYKDPNAESADGLFAAVNTVSNDGENEYFVFAYDTAADQVIFRTRVAFDPDVLCFVGENLFAGDSFSGKFAVLDPNGNLLSEWDLKEKIKTAAGIDYCSTYEVFFAPLERNILFGNSDGVFEVTPDGEIQCVFTGSGLKYHSMAGKAVTFSCVDYKTRRTVVTTYLLDRGRFITHGEGFAYQSVEATAMHENGAVAILTKDGTVVISDTQGNCRTLSYDPTELAPKTIAFTPDGKSLIAVCASGVCVRYDLAGMCEAARFDFGDKLQDGATLTFLPDSAVLIRARYGLDGRLVDVETMTCRAYLEDVDCYLAASGNFFGHIYLDGAYRGILIPYLSYEELIAYAKTWLEEQS